MKQSKFDRMRLTIRTRRACVVAVFRGFWMVLALAVLQSGCATSPTSNPDPVAYIGVSSHLKRAKNGSNLETPYKSHPTYGEDSKSRARFHLDAAAYLDGVDTDLKTILEIAANARDKVNSALASAAGAGRFYYRHIGEVIRLGWEPTNIASVLGYPQFPDFTGYPPEPPIYRSRYTVETYNRQLLDFTATVDSYVEDGKQFIRNCEVDVETIRKSRSDFVNYLNQLRSSGAQGR